MTEREATLRKAVGDMIRRARKALKVSATDIAEEMTEAGFPANRDTILRVESGKARLPLVHALWLFNRIGISLSDLSLDEA